MKPIVLFLLGIGELGLGSSVVGLGLVVQVWAGQLDSSWYFRFTGFFATLVAFDLIRTGYKRVFGDKQ
jgi:hypothetical protein